MNKILKNRNLRSSNDNSKTLQLVNRHPQAD